MPLGISPKGMHKKNRMKGDQHSATGVGKAGSAAGGGGRGSMMTAKKGARKGARKSY